MTSITTKLIKDGNSMAVRLPKTLLTMTGLYGFVRLEAKEGQIIIRQDKRHPRDGWEDQINKVLREKEHIEDDDFSDMDVTIADGLGDLPWNGLSYEEWKKQNAKK